eukprot:g80825.t1
MTSIDARISAAQQLRLNMDSSLTRLENSNDGANKAELTVDIRKTLTKFKTELDALETAVECDGSMLRNKYRQRLQQFKHLAEEFEKSVTFAESRNAQYNRQRLLEGYSPGPANSSRAQAHLDQNASLLRSRNELIDNIAMAQQTLTNLKMQGETLKRAHQSILDVANRLGLSSSIIRMIERKDFTNRLLVYGGMLLTMLVIGATWYYFRYLPRNHA